MDMKVDALIREMQALQSQASGKPAEAVPATESDFGQLLKDAVDKVNGMQQHTNDLRTRFELGDRSISLAQVMLAGQKSSIAFEATVQVRNKLIEAYKNIMSMPV
ncbi:flagellar hook-basal body complex protein FliE [Dongshaea marina]|uniref:flagellar hook-basal body complex protein FliE n=1 Tax=Dongshaea marina TaxID=2047966 RepID=UPI000D3E378B|nr:flagellar hook-basal body complex protein FliE [Dongshaea marina]